jgi:DNA-binding transcriptional MocR family regulator
MSGPGLDLAKGDAPDLSHLPPIGIDILQLNATCGGAAVNTAGLPATRQAIADLYARGATTGRPRPTETQEVHVTAGSHQATHLVISTLADRGASVIDRPDGGSIIWARFPVADSAILVNVARRHGVRLALGSIHTPTKAPGPFIRIDVDRPATVFHEGIERLARAWQELKADERLLAT